MGDHVTLTMRLAVLLLACTSALAQAQLKQNDPLWYVGWLKADHPLRGSPFVTEDHEACERLCTVVSNCNYFAFAHVGCQTAIKPQCWLYFNSPPNLEKSCLTLGTVEPRPRSSAPHVDSDMLARLSAQILWWAHPGVQEPWTHTLFLMDLRHALLMVGFYVTFIVVGRAMMQNRPKFVGHKPVQLMYNGMQILLCSGMVISGLRIAQARRFELVCNAFSEDEHVNSSLALLTWVFFLSKVLDFWDTVWIILAKNWRQLTFLHVYHHISIFLIYWMNAKVCYDGDIFLTIVLNSGVHVVMYAYYLCTMLDYKPRWKVLVTFGQLVQFVCMMVQAVYMLGSGCSRPAQNVIVTFFFYIFSLFLLFLNFAAKTYFSGTKDKKKGQ